MFKQPILSKTTFSLGRFIVKHWYLITLLIILIPSIISTIKIAYETNNPTYPFFELAKRLISADNVLEKDINTLQTNPSELIGMDNPDSGIWNHTKYYWKIFFNVIWKISGNVWLIFFPFTIIFSLVKLKNTSEQFKNFIISLIIFLVYLFVTNTIILIHGLVSGNILIAIPEGLDSFKEYLFLFKQTLPFHGLISLVKYIIYLVI